MSYQTSILDFQKRLIRTAMMVPRSEGLNLFNIVYKNLLEFAEVRVVNSSDPHANAQALMDTFDLWASAVHTRFPNLVENANFLSNAGANIVATKYPFCIVNIDTGHQVCIRYDATNPAEYGEWSGGPLPGIIYFEKDVYANDKEILKVPTRDIDDRDYAQMAYVLMQNPVDRTTSTKFALVYTDDLQHIPESIKMTFDADPNRYVSYEMGRSILPYGQSGYTMYFRHAIFVHFSECVEMLKSNVLPTIFEYGEDAYTSEYGHATASLQHVWKNATQYHTMLRLPLMQSSDANREFVSTANILTSYLHKKYSHLGGKDTYGFLTEYCTEMWATIYRTETIHGDDSIYDDINSNAYLLMYMANQLHKKCHVFIEVRARGDEQNNLRLYTMLKNAGADVHIIAKGPRARGKKVHAKVWSFAFIQKSLPHSQTVVSLLSTGNFNANSQKLYRDTVKIINTSKDEFKESILPMFDAIMNRKSKARSAATTATNGFVWGDGVRTAIHDMLHDKINMKRMQNDGLIPRSDLAVYIKCNHILDKTSINLIVQAAKVGVNVTCIVRTSCGLPIMPGLDTLHVYSIVGRYLEHDRIYMSTINDRIDMCLISTADLMHRNLHNRIEFAYELKGEDAMDAFNLFNNYTCNCGLWDTQNGLFVYDLTGRTALPDSWADEL